MEGLVEAEGDSDDWLMGSPSGIVCDVVRLTRLYSEVVATQRESPLLRARTTPLAMGTSLTTIHLPIPTFARMACFLLMTQRLTKPSPSIPPSSSSASSRTTVLTPRMRGRRFEGRGSRLGRCSHDRVDSATTAATPMRKRTSILSMGFPEGDMTLLEASVNWSGCER